MGKLSDRLQKIMSIIYGIIARFKIRTMVWKFSKE